MWSSGLQRESTEETIGGGAIDVDGQEMADFLFFCLEIHDAIAIGASAELTIPLFCRRFNEHFLYCSDESGIQRELALFLKFLQLR